MPGYILSSHDESFEIGVSECEGFKRWRYSELSLRTQHRTHVRFAICCKVKGLGSGRSDPPLSAR